MPVRTRKIVGSFGVVFFVIAYAALVVTIAEHLPDLWWVKALFFTPAGILWGVPILPLLKWMNGHGEEA
jgi:hypothetical protein